MMFPKPSLSINFERARRAALLLVISSSMGITACTKKIDNLKDENSNLKAEVVKLKGQNADLNDQKQKIQESVRNLQTRVTEFEAATGTIEQLAKSIEEKTSLKNDLESALSALNVEKQEALATIEKAGADKADAEQRLATALQEEEKIRALQSELDSRQSALDKAIANWREIYSKHKLDHVFDRLTDEKKLSDVMSFQVSVVGFNLSPEDVTSIRNILKRIVAADDNKYKSDFKQSPEQTRIEEGIKAKANGGVRSYFVANEININDTYLVATKGEELIKIREELAQFNSKDRAVFMVNRLVEKLSVSVSLRVHANVGESYINPTVKPVYVGTISQPKEVALDLMKDFDVTKPIESMFSSASCSSMSAQCLADLKANGYLDIKVKTGNGQSIALREFLKNSFENSAIQTMSDIQDLNSEKIEYSLGGKILAEIASSRARKYVHGDNMEKIYVDNGEAGPTQRLPVVTRVELVFSVNMIEDLPYTGVIPIDFAVNNSAESMALAIKDGKLHIGLPVKQSRSLVMDIESEVNQYIKDRFEKSGTKVQFEQSFGRKNAIFSNFADVLR